MAAFQQLPQEKQTVEAANMYKAAGKVISGEFGGVILGTAANGTKALIQVGKGETAVGNTVLAEGIGSTSTGMPKSIFSNGKVNVEAIEANPSVFSGKSVDEVAQMLKNAGYDVTVQSSTRSTSGAKIIKINNPDNGKNISQVQVSPGGGRHGGNPYVKISTTDQGIIKVVDGAESAYKTDGTETAKIIFTGGE